jgi:hypothetical protein
MSTRIPPTQPDRPGASALREYHRRHRNREANARARLGALGALLARATGDPDTTSAWKHGAQAEIYAAAQLQKHLRRTDVVLLHDRRILGRGRANIDHLAIGPGGVTVIDTKAAHGRIQLTKVGGLLSARQELLLVNGRDRTRQLDALERQIETIKRVLTKADITEVDVRGALCYPNIDALPLLGQLRARNGTLIIDDPRGVAKLARRAGALGQGDVQRIAEQLALRLPQA